MITLKQGIEKYLEQYPKYAVDSIFDVGDEWVIGARDRETGEEIDVSPIAVSKENGNMRVFFPPANRAKMAHAIEIDMSEIGRG